MTRIARLLFAFALFAAAPTWAADSYLTSAQVDLVILLPPPPAPGSAQEQTEMAEVLALQAARSPERAAQTVADSHESVFDQFGQTLGPKFDPAALPRVTALFDRLGETEEVLTETPKKAFGRLRPFQSNPLVHPSAPLSKSGSWPSGHATRVTMMGIVLAAMIPEQRAPIAVRIDDYKESRVIGGVHYRSDIVMGARAGTATAAVLMNDTAFLADFRPARAELRRALGLPE